MFHTHTQAHIHSPCWRFIGRAWVNTPPQKCPPLLLTCTHTHALAHTNQSLAHCQMQIVYGDSDIRVRDSRDYTLADVYSMIGRTLWLDWPTHTNTRTQRMQKNTFVAHTHRWYDSRVVPIKPRANWTRKQSGGYTVPSNVVDTICSIAAHSQHDICLFAVLSCTAEHS